MHRANLLALGLSAVLLGALAFQGKLNVFSGSPFPWHPICMTLAFLLLPVASIVYKSPKLGGGGKANTITHGNIMSGAAVVGLAGWYAIYLNKERMGKPHLTSYHSYTGVACLGFFVMGAVGSYFALHPDGGALKTNTTVRTGHKLTSRAAIALAFVTIASGCLPLLGNKMVAALGCGLALLAALVLT